MLFFPSLPRCMIQMIISFDRHQDEIALQKLELGSKEGHWGPGSVAGKKHTLKFASHCCCIPKSEILSDRPRVWDGFKMF